MLFEKILDVERENTHVRVKAVGLDNIPARLLKDAADTVAKPLTIILNASLQSGRVPDDWKAARVTPLFKKGKVRLRIWITTVRFL